jgi:hypothetical protein
MSSKQLGHKNQIFGRKLNKGMTCLKGTCMGKSDSHDITEKILKMGLNTITITLTQVHKVFSTIGCNHLATLSHNVVSSTPRLSVIRTHCIGNCKSNYHTIMTTTAPYELGKLS